MRSFGLSENDSQQYAIVKGKFDSYFVKGQNVIYMYEWPRFNCRKQEDGKSVDSFITDLHTLAEHCDFGALHDQLIRDRIVLGIMDSKLSEQLQSASTTVHYRRRFCEGTINWSKNPKEISSPGVKPSAHKKPSLFTRSTPQPPMPCPRCG